MKTLERLFKDIESIHGSPYSAVEFINTWKEEILKASLKEKQDYAEDCVKASLDKASKNKKGFYDPVQSFFYVVPESINTKENIVLL